MIRTGLFGGTFNPIHIGHIALAQWLIDKDYFDEVWLMLSPENPLKADRPGATDANRREMLALACRNHAGLKPCFVEFDLPRPSYTVDTLRYLSATCPDRKFALIIGADNWQIFNKWRNPDEILLRHGVVVYPRPGYNMPNSAPAGVVLAYDAPQTDVSSSQIRQSVAANASMLPAEVADYIKRNSLYARTDQIK